MLDRPDASELLAAVASFLEDEVVPASSGRRRFHALVAANAARIVARELDGGAQRLDEEIADLWTLLGCEGAPPPGGDRRALALDLATRLCERIEKGDADQGEWRARVLAYLKRHVGRRLDVDNPKFGR